MKPLVLSLFAALLCVLPALAGIDLDPARQYTLRLELPGYIRLLNLGEIQVFSGDENIALRGQAKMSSEDAKYNATKLINGRTIGSSNDPQGDLAHTYFETKPWAEIRLPAAQRIDKIVVWNRAPDCEDCHSRLLPFELILIDDKGQTVWKKLIRKGRIQTRPEAKRGDTTFQKFEVPVTR